MNRFLLVALFCASLSTWAQGAVNGDVKFQSAGPSVTSKITFMDTSINDWAGSVMRAQVTVVAAGGGNLVGSVKFTYSPEDKLVAIAIKQSSGNDDFTITGQIADFTDLEGRRIVSLTPGRAIEIEMPVNVPYTTAGQPMIKDFMVEVEPTEYLSH